MLVAHDQWPDGFCAGLLGYVHCTYERLVEVFGPPNRDCDGDGKTDAEWLLRDTITHAFATIYNYKDGKNYLGDEGLDLADIIEWHVGGSDRKVLKLVQDAIE